ncbi:hypothetical protein EZS27_030613 [termite gut metagenome]|uniref:Uncharacterized protein n=1 Tax=termite gut metagenome TaxID=433724 RepID=A0A5J4QF27_9ZZZZ
MMQSLSLNHLYIMTVEQVHIIVLLELDLLNGLINMDQMPMQRDCLLMRDQYPLNKQDGLWLHSADASFKITMFNLSKLMMIIIQNILLESHGWVLMMQA